MNDMTESEVLSQIDEGRDHIQKQKARIASLTDAGEDTSEANALLARLEEGQQAYADRLENLRKPSQ